MSTNPSHYYARQLEHTEPTPPAPTWLEQWGEVIAAGLGLVVIGFAAAMIVVGLVMA